MKYIWGFISTIILASAAHAGMTDWGIGMIPAASDGAQDVHDFHELLMYIITGIVVVVLLLLIYVSIRFRAKANPTPSKTSHNTLLEIVWTGIPVIILVVIMVRSLPLLYEQDTIPEAEVTVKVTGYQWYWGYEYPDHGDIAFDSYMIPNEDIKDGQYRVLDVDNRVVLPVDTVIKFQITAADVLHSWAMPALAIKRDSVPGRLNETWTKINKPGVYYGQCSEICGSGHAFMPIAIEAVSKEEFVAWVKEQGGKMPTDETIATLTNNNL